MTIKINELFSGIGAQVAALKRIGVPYEIVGISEIDKYAIQSYESINGKTRNYGDISKIEQLDYADLWTYSSPCFTADSLILTETRGFQKITDIKIGEKVVTHDGSYKIVENVINNGIKKTIKIYGMGIDEIHTTPNHLFYVREKSHVWNNKLRSSIRTFSKPVWKCAASLKRTDYLGVPVNNKSEIPNWDGITFSWSDGRKDRHKNQLSCYMDNEDFWWVIGRYVADGWVKNNGGIIISCGKKKFAETKCKFDKLNINYTVTEERTVFKFNFSLKELRLFVKPFGEYAYGKKIPSFVMNLPVHLLESFIDGYMAGDGCFTQNRYKCTSVSRELIYGIAQCVAKVFKQPYSVYKTKKPKTTIIEGRTVNQKDSYELCFKKHKCNQDKAFYENGFLWFPVNKIEDSDAENVYDLSVEENHSFTVQGTIVHNCTDFSTAGKQEGLYKADGTLTRSGLLLHVERLLRTSVKQGNQPKYLLMENVKGLVSKKFMPDFLQWLNTLEEIGFNNYWKVLNAKDYGVPQNRERVFVVSIRKDVDTKGYNFPQSAPLQLRLKDMLEHVVDEKYYLSDEKVSNLIAQMVDKKLQPNQLLSTEQRIEMNCTGCANTLATVQKDDIVVEPQVLTPKRTDYGKQMRKSYELGLISESRHNMTSMEPRTDGICNTLTTVQKDNLVMLQKPHGFNKGGVHEVAPTLTSGGSYQENNFVVEQIASLTDKNHQQDRVYSSNGLCPTLPTMATGGNLQPKIIEECMGHHQLSKKFGFFGYRIRKLTPKECWRLMSFTDDEFEKAKKAGVSNTQLYKQAGNSIVVDVLAAIFGEMFK